MSKVVILVVLFTSFFYIVSKKDNNYKNETLVAGETTSLTSSPTLSPSPLPSEIVTPSVTKVVATPSPTPIPAGSQASGIKSSLFYPGASIISQSSNEFVLQSSDSPDTITPWYKEKIKSMGMSSKSFVTTKTNGNVLNKLVGADGKNEIRVEISKQANESITVIKLYFVIV